MGAFVVVQQTRNGMFNATSLLRQYNIANKTHKSLGHFFDNLGTQEFIVQLMTDLNLHDRNSVYVKSRASRGEMAGTWMHPYLFIKLAMWLSREFEVSVIRFVTDNLLFFRNEAGDKYRPFCSAIASLSEDVDYSLISKTLNLIVFGRHKSGIRQDATEEELKDLAILEEKITMLINDGYISSMKQLKKAFKKEYRKRNG